MSQYSIPIDKELLYEFLVADQEMIGDIHFKEVEKLMTVVFYRYQSSHMNIRQEVFSEVLCTILQRRSTFDLTRDAYNYLFTQMRNEMGNVCYRLTKELKSEDVLNLKEQDCSPEEPLDMLPPSVVRYYHYLTGEEDFTLKRIAKKDVLDLMIYLRTNDRSKEVPIPDYFKNIKNLPQVMYKLLKDVLPLIIKNDDLSSS